MFETKVPLTQYSNYKIGGSADYFYRAKDVDRLILAVQKAREKKLPIFILGGGTNLLISDKGFAGLVIKPEINLLKADSGLVRAGAGLPMSELLNYSIAKSLSGLEWAGGLPGTLGGAIRGNAGAFGGEIKDMIKEVVSLDISSPKPKIVKRTNIECNFGYRDSIFKKRDGGNPSTGSGPEIILEVVLDFKKGDKKAIKKAIDEKINYRKTRHPMEYPNIGSIFKNVDLRRIPKKRQQEFSQVVKTDPFPVVPTAYLISQTGVKGVHFGGAMISPKHPNFIVNVLQAKASDVENLINLVKLEVKKKFDIELEEEVIYVK